VLPPRSRPPPGIDFPSAPVSRRPADKREQERAHAWAMERVEASINALTGLRSEWHLGAQYLHNEVFVTNSNSPKWKARLSENVMRNTLEILQGRVRQFTPQIGAEAASDDLSDAMGADAAANFARYLVRKCAFEASHDDCVQDAMVCGLMWWAVNLDARGGAFLGKVGEVDLYEQDVMISRPDPVEMLWEPGAQYQVGVPLHEMMPWIIHQQFLTADQVEALHPDCADAIPDATGHATVLRDTGETESDTAQGRNDIGPRILYQQIFHVPTKRMGHGRYVILADDIVLHDWELPYHRRTAKHRKNGRACEPIVFPYVVRPWRRIRRRFAGDGARDLIPVQKAIAQSLSGNLDHERLVQYATIICRGFSAEDKGLIGEPGCIIDNLQPGESLEYAEPTPRDARHWLTRDVLHDVVNSSSGLNDVTRGDKPAGVDRATTTLALRDADDTRTSVLAETIIDGEQEACRMALQLAQLLDLPRQIEINGEDNYAETIEFRGADLRGFTDVRLTIDKSLPSNRATREEVVMRRKEAGVWTAAEVRDVIDSPRAGVWSKVAQRRKNFRRDISRILRRGEIVLVRAKSDHGLAAELGRDMREENLYRGTPPDRKAALEAWIEEHEIQLIREAADPIGAALHQTYAMQRSPVGLDAAVAPMAPMAAQPGQGAAPNAAGQVDATGGLSAM